MRSFATGIAAGLAYVTVELLGRVLAAVPTVPELIQDQLVLLLPGPLFSFVLDRLLYLGKPLLFGGLLTAQVITLGCARALTARWRNTFGLAAILWLVTGFVLLPLARVRVMAGRLDFAITSLVSFIAYGAALQFFSNRTSPAPTARENSLTRTIDWLSEVAGRRRLVGGGALFLLSLVLARRIIGTVPTVPPRVTATSGGPAGAGQPTSAPTTPGGEAVIPGMPPEVTPAATFYVVSKNIIDPTVDAATWHLQVTGMVNQPITLSYTDLLALPAQRRYQTLECISNVVGGNLMSNGHWTGVPLGEILRRAGIGDGAAFVNFTSVDGYTEFMPLDQALYPSTLLVYQLDDAPLPTKHGFPARILGTGTYGMKNPKWLTEIAVGRSPVPGFWEQQGWDAGALVKTTSRIDVPADGATVTGPNVLVAGLAFAGARGIQRVEVSTDGGTTWSVARLMPPLGPYTWVFWNYTWGSAEVGPHLLVVRATDAQGQPQITTDSSTYPAGATGYDQVRVEVQG